jgi:hypothetical protein
MGRPEKVDQARRHSPMWRRNNHRQDRCLAQDAIRGFVEGIAKGGKGYLMLRPEPP